MNFVWKTGAALIALGVVLVVSQREAIEARMHPLPELDASSPRSQNGFKWLRLSERPYHTTELIIDTSQLPDINYPTKERWYKIYSPAKAFQASARDSTGQTWQLGWSIGPEDKQAKGWETSASKEENRLHLFLPKAYPPYMKWVDINLKDAWGRTASWRLKHLPRAKNIVGDPAQVVDT